MILASILDKLAFPCLSLFETPSSRRRRHHRPPAIDDDAAPLPRCAQRRPRKPVAWRGSPNALLFFDIYILTYGYTHIYDVNTPNSYVVRCLLSIFLLKFLLVADPSLLLRIRTSARASALAPHPIKPCLRSLGERLIATCLGAHAPWRSPCP